MKIGKTSAILGIGKVYADQKFLLYTYKLSAPINQLWYKLGNLC